MDIYLDYYGTWYFTHKLVSNEVVQSGTTSYIYDSNAKFTNYMYVNSYQVVKIDLHLSRDFDRYTFYNPGNFLTSNPNPGQVIKTASTGQSSLIQMLIILCLLSQIGGLHSFMYSLLSTVIETFNKKMYQIEISNLLRFIKSNSNSSAFEYNPSEFNLGQIGSKVKPISDENQEANNMKNGNKVKFIETIFSIATTQSQDLPEKGLIQNKILSEAKILKDSTLKLNQTLIFVSLRF